MHQRHSEGGEITLLEAGTGIGKSLGYVIPLLMNSVLTGEKCLISTYTLALQKQLMEIDGPVACEAVSRLTGKPPPTMARRVGRRNFVDYDRVADLIAETEREGQNAISSILREWLNAAPSTFEEAGQDFGLVLPSSITQDDVCVTAGSSLDASRFYLDHVEVAHNADIVIINHALAIIDAKAWGHQIVNRDDARRRVAVFDEANTLPSVARDMAERRLPISTMKALAKELPRGDIRATLKDAVETLRLRLREALDNGPVIIDQGQEQLVAEVEIVRVAMEAAESIGEEDIRDDLRRLRAEVEEWLSAARGERHTVAVAAASPVKSRPALVTISTNPARILSRLWNRPKDGGEPFLRAIVFTSATLSTGEGNWSDFMNAMGINPAWSNYSSARSAIFSPRRFGELSFMLADRTVPAPFSGQGQVDEDWVAYAAAGIEAARKRGGRVMVLCASYDDVGRLAQKLQGVLAHHRGDSLSRLLETYKAVQGSVLLTPAAWTGVSLPGLVDHLVIPRIPFGRPDEARDAVHTRAMVARGVNPATAQAILRAQAQADTKRKLRQGLGRAIRRASDKATIWVLDPRFPLPSSMIRNNRRLRLTQGLAVNHIGLMKVIPSRFRDGFHSSFDRAEVSYREDQKVSVT